MEASGRCSVSTCGGSCGAISGGWLDMGIETTKHLHRGPGPIWIQSGSPSTYLPTSILQGGITSTERRRRESQFSSLPTVPENCDGVLSHFALSLRWFPLLEPVPLSRCKVENTSSILTVRHLLMWGRRARNKMTLILLN